MFKKPATRETVLTKAFTNCSFQTAFKGFFFVPHKQHDATIQSLLALVLPCKRWCLAIRMSSPAPMFKCSFSLPSCLQSLRIWRTSILRCQIPNLLKNNSKLSLLFLSFILIFFSLSSLPLKCGTTLTLGYEILSFQKNSSTFSLFLLLIIPILGLPPKKHCIGLIKNYSLQIQFWFFLKKLKTTLGSIGAWEYRKI